MDTFNFCPDTNVPRTLPPDPVAGISMNGWSFTSKPTVPYQKSFTVKLFGLKWYLDPATGLYDTVTDPTHNARLLEIFYEQHGVWSPFNWTHQHLGPLVVRFKTAVTVPEALEMSNGLVDGLDITLIHHNPGYS